MEEDQPQRFAFFHSQNSSIVSKPMICSRRGRFGRALRAKAASSSAIRRRSAGVRARSRSSRSSRAALNGSEADGMAVIWHVHPAEAVTQQDRVRIPPSKAGPSLSVPGSRGELALHDLSEQLRQADLEWRDVRTWTPGEGRTQDFRPRFPWAPALDYASRDVHDPVVRDTDALEQRPSSRGATKMSGCTRVFLLELDVRRR